MPATLEAIRLPAGDPAVDEEIDALLARCPTSFAQQTRGWRDVITSLGGDEAAWLGCRWNQSNQSTRQGGQLIALLPAFRFEGPLGAILVSVPQAGPLGGIACAPEAPREAVYETLLAAFCDLAAALHCDLASVISNPFWPDRELYERYLKPDYTLENSLHALDLTSDCGADGALVNAASNVRRNLRRAQSGALFVDEEQSAANVEEWYAIHVERHLEIGATPLPKELIFGALQHMVPKGLARFFFVRLSETREMASGGLYLCHGSVVDAFMPSLRSRHAPHRPNHLLASHSIGWARENGFRYYNWQGSPPGSGVERFKRQWGGREYDYCFFTRITGDPSPYLDSSVSQLLDGYRWHYVLPFDRLGTKRAAALGPSSRSGAWDALETAE